MNTLIVPCAGKSGRFPGLKPKWMLTHPDGKLMCMKAIEGLPDAIFSRIIITYVRPHDETYDAGFILRQAFKDNPIIEYCLLDDFTSSSCETVYETIRKMNVSGSFMVKDSDNFVKADYPENLGNSVSGWDVKRHPEVTRLPEKSFLEINTDGTLKNIEEKNIISNTICIGVYTFESTETFCKAYKEIIGSSGRNVKELYISHLISYLLKKGKKFRCIMADEYEDWGTLAEWRAMQTMKRSYFVDVDGVLIKNCGKYGRINWYNNKEILAENFAVLRELQSKGAQIIITTSRTEECRPALEQLLREQGIRPHAIIMGINHAARVMVNDFAPTNPYPSAIAVTFPRNGNLKDYIG